MRRKLISVLKTHQGQRRTFVIFVRGENPLIRETFGQQRFDLVPFDGQMFDEEMRVNRIAEMKFFVSLRLTDFLVDRTEKSKRIFSIESSQFALTSRSASIVEILSSNNFLKLCSTKFPREIDRSSASLRRRNRRSFEPAREEGEKDEIDIQTSLQSG